MKIKFKKNAIYKQHYFRHFHSKIGILDGEIFNHLTVNLNCEGYLCRPIYIFIFSLHNDSISTTTSSAFKQLAMNTESIT